MKKSRFTEAQIIAVPRLSNLLDTLEQPNPPGPWGVEVIGRTLDWYSTPTK